MPFTLPFTLSIVTTSTTQTERDKQMRYTPANSSQTVPAYDLTKNGTTVRTFNKFEAKEQLAEFGWSCRTVNVCINLAKEKYNYNKQEANRIAI